MTTAAELLDKLNRPMESTELAVENAIAIYRHAAALARAMAEVQKEAKRVIEEIIVETGQDKWTTPAGKCSITKPGATVRYDSKALDALAASNDQIAKWLAPHRREQERAGTLRITK